MRRLFSVLARAAFVLRSAGDFSSSVPAHTHCTAHLPYLCTQTPIFSFTTLHTHTLPLTAAHTLWQQTFFSFRYSVLMNTTWAGRGGDIDAPHCARTARSPPLTLTAPYRASPYYFKAGGTGMADMNKHYAPMRRERVAVHPS